MAMSGRMLLLFGHVVSATLLVGGSLLALPAVMRAMRLAGTVQELRACLRIGRSVAVASQFSSLVVLATGLYLAAAAHLWQQPWVQVATAFWVVNAAVAARVLKPAMGQLAGAAFSSEAGSVSPRLAALRDSPRLTLAANALLANNVALLYMMVARPGLLPSLLAPALANGALLAWELWRGRRAAAQRPVLAQES